MALTVTSKVLPLQSLHVQPSLTDIDVLKEKRIFILSFCLLAAFSNLFSEKYSISNISQKKYDSSQTPEAALAGCLWMLLLLERIYAVGRHWLTQHEEVSCT